jgi:hypothetical protein
MPMALYKDQSDVARSDDEAFDNTYEPPATAPHSGIYKCVGCGREITAISRNPLPTEDHHEHTNGQGSVRWRMVVFAQG